MIQFTGLNRIRIVGLLVFGVSRVSFDEVRENIAAKLSLTNSRRSAVRSRPDIALMDGSGRSPSDRRPGRSEREL